MCTLARLSFYPPSFLPARLMAGLSAVFVAEWRTGGPAHQVVKSVDLIPLFFSKMSKAKICTLARHSSCPPSLWRTGGPAHQVVKNEDTTPLFSYFETMPIVQLACETGSASTGNSSCKTDMNFPSCNSGR